MDLMNADHKNQEASIQRQDAKGWDPYEVWRSQVLLPRLEAQNLHLKPIRDTARAARPTHARPPIKAA